MIVFTPIEEYIKLLKEERQTHFDLSEPCIKRGGTNAEFRGVLAVYLNTSIPYKMKGKICCCHACNNENCSNPKHLYWGTNKKNLQDASDCGAWKHVDYYTRAKYTVEEYNLIKKNAGKAGGRNRNKNSCIQEKVA